MAKKSMGVTATERMLADFCERSFLKLWSYANPFKDDGNELCDLLAVFGNYVFIFFDRESELSISSDKDPHVLWNRWKRNVIDRQIRTAHGAEKYIRSGRNIFLDAKNTEPFPLPFDRNVVVIHKVIVAHGAKEACERDSPENIYGSLAITYSDPTEDTDLFHIVIDKKMPIHLLDSHNMPIVLGELNTVTDFAAYLDEKVRAIRKFDYLSYCGEEDLLAHFLLNYDSKKKRHIIGPSDYIGINGVMIEEGEWHRFIKSDTYRNTKVHDRPSYFWDELIQKTCQNYLDNTLSGNSDILKGESAIFEMVKEPRFMRRGIAEKMLSAVARFPDSGKWTRQLTYLPSFEKNSAYILLQLQLPEEIRTTSDYREKRQQILEIACGATKNRFSNLKKIIGIAVDAPRIYGAEVAEDFILMSCERWTKEMKCYYEELNKDWCFYETPNLQKYDDKVTRFVPNGSSTRPKVGRNDLCPCGSGKKFKRCHGG